MARDSYVNTRLTASDQALVKEAAQRRNLKPSEFCRLALLAAARRPHPILQTLIEEVAATRYILNNIVLYHLTTDGKEINKTTLSTICASADAFKADKTRRLLEAATAQIHDKDA